MSDESREKLPPRARQYIANSRALREAMHAWAEHSGGIGSGGAHDRYGKITFHWEIGPDQPRAELTLWADLNDDDRPVIRVSFPAGFEPGSPEPEQSADVATPRSAPAHPEVAVTSSSVMCLRGTDLPPVEPDQQCEACGAQGTVGRAIRFTPAGEIHEMHRFCAECWPEQQSRYQARWRHQSVRERDARLRGAATGGLSGMSTAFESSTWDGVSSLIDGLREHAMTRGRAAQHDLRRFADEMFDTRDAHVGTMPFEVASFIAQHTSRTLPPNFPDG